MRECLRKVANLATAWIDLLGVKPDVVRVGQHPLEGILSLFQRPELASASTQRKEHNEKAVKARRVGFQDLSKICRHIASRLSVQRWMSPGRPRSRDPDPSSCFHSRTGAPAIASACQ